MIHKQPPTGFVAPRNLAFFFHNKNILITGASGFLGQNLIQTLAGIPCHLFCCTRNLQNSFTPLNSKASLRWIHASYASPLFWAKNLRGIDILFHLAAQTDLQRSESKPVKCFEANVVPVLQMTAACHELRLRPIIIFASTATIFGMPKKLPVSEKHPDNPMTFYDLHKKTSEQYLHFYSKQNRIHAVSLRFSNIFGPGPCSKNKNRGILNQMIKKALAGEPLPLYGKGAELRDYLFISDALHALLLAARHAKRLDGNSFLIASGKGWSLRHCFNLIARKVSKQTKKSVTISSVPAPPNSPGIQKRNFIGSFQAFRKKTGWQPEIDLSTGIDKTILEES